jgi:predicted membrane-bound spermidine synthase
VRALRAVVPLFFLSGVSGLIYEVIWIRQFGNVFGNTVYSTALVSAVFMSGLGVGSLLGGAWVDRRFASGSKLPLRAYGIAEVSIGLFGLLLAVLLPRLGDLSTAIASYVRDQDGWYAPSFGSYLLLYLLAVVLLMPSTTLMGATLTLLIRYLVQRDLGSAGKRIGILYGVNTLGAALGCFLTDFLLIPSVGLSATQSLAVVLNLAAGLGALRLAGALPDEGSVPSPAPAVLVPSSGRAIVLSTGAAIFLAGFAQMGMEIVWFRHLITQLGALRAVLSLLLTVILLGIWLGAVIGGWLNERIGRPVALYLGAQALFAVSALGLIAWVQKWLHVDEAYYASLSDAGRAVYRVWLVGRPMLLMVGLPALLMGTAYPLANAQIQRVEGSVGRRAGFLYLANTLGAVLGSLVTGFILLPALGVQRAILVLAAGTALGLVPAYLAGRSVAADPGATAWNRRVLVGALASTILAMFVWTRLPPDRLLVESLSSVLRQGSHVLDVKEGPNELLAIVDSPAERFLVTNGHKMAGTHPLNRRYMRAFSHLPLLMLDHDADRVLVICFGTGNTLGAAAKHRSVKALEIADLSRNVLEHASFFSESNGDVLKDPRLSVFVDDGRQHLRAAPPGAYSLITMEPPPINFAGVSALYSEEFYQLVRSRLEPGGYVSQWLPAHEMSEDASRAMVRAFIDVFPATVLLSGKRSELILLGRNADRIEIDPDRIAARLAADPELTADLRAIHLATPTELIGMFVGSSETLRRATRNSPPVTDDYPIMEYASTIHLLETEIPADLFEPASVDSWCPRCFGPDGRPAPAVPRLDRYLSILENVYRSPSFLKRSWWTRIENPPSLSVDDPEIVATLDQSAYLRFLFFGKTDPLRNPDPPEH